MGRRVTGLRARGVFVLLLLGVALAKADYLTSLAEDDASLGDSKKFEDAMGPEEMKKISTLSASCIDSVQDNLFSFDPKMSYPAEEWIKADSFWKPKTAAAAKPVTSTWSSRARPCLRLPPPTRLAPVPY